MGSADRGHMDGIRCGARDRVSEARDVRVSRPPSRAHISFPQAESGGTSRTDYITPALRSLRSLGIGQPLEMDATGSTGREVSIRLTRDEAFVLSDALARWEAAGDIARLMANERAALRVLSDLTSSLEPVVDAAFSADYAEHLRRAQTAVLSE